MLPAAVAVVALLITLGLILLGNFWFIKRASDRAERNLTKRIEELEKQCYQGDYPHA